MLFLLRRSSSFLGGAVGGGGGGGGATRRPAAACSSLRLSATAHDVRHTCLEPRQRSPLLVSSRTCSVSSASSPPTRM